MIYIALTALFILIVIFIVFKILTHNVKAKDGNTNVESLIGKEALVIKEIDPFICGYVRVGPHEWKATSKEEIEIGEKVIILSIEGNKLIVKKI